jgi:hypothetical protein
MYVIIIAATVAGCASSAETAISETFIGAVPKSVKVLNIYESGTLLSTMKLWVHFNIDKNDLVTVIDAEGFKETSNISWKFDHLDPPKWWVPRKLGGKVRKFELEHNPHDVEKSQWKKLLLVNDAMSEVYCLKLYYD